MSKEYSERFLQNKVIELFKNIGYEYLSPQKLLKKEATITEMLYLKISSKIK